MERSKCCYHTIYYYYCYSIYVVYKQRSRMLVSFILFSPLLPCIPHSVPTYASKDKVKCGQGDGQRGKAKKDARSGRMNQRRTKRRVKSGLEQAALALVSITSAQENSLSFPPINRERWGEGGEGERNSCLRPPSVSSVRTCTPVSPRSPQCYVHVAVLRT